MTSLVILLASSIVGALSAMAFVIVVRSGILHPGDHHGHHAGDTGPVSGGIAARLAMLEHAVEEELAAVREAASREFESAGRLAQDLAFGTDSRVASGENPRPSPQAAGPGAAGLAGRVRLPDGHDAASDSAQTATGGAAVEIPPEELERASKRQQDEQQASGDADSVWEPAKTQGRNGRRPKSQNSARSSSASGGSDSGVSQQRQPGGRASSLRASGGSGSGSFAGSAAGRKLATCQQIETDGRLRLRPRERLKYKALTPTNKWAVVGASTPSNCPQRPNRDYTRHPITIYQQGRRGKVPDGRFDCPKAEILKCPFGCWITGDTAAAATADVALSVVPGNTATRQGHCPLQKQALFSMENEVYYPTLALTEANMRTYDFIGTTHLASDIPLGYGGWYDFNYLEPPSPKTATAMAVAVISNCAGHNGRLQYIRALVKAGVTVHHMGRCDHNFDWQPPSGRSKGRFVDKIDMLRPYKFTLAFENTNTLDYVTEKYFQPLVAGSVPVYMGAPNSEVYAPGPNSVIRTDDFPSAQALAKHLLWLSENEEEYNKLLEWKYTGVSEGFQRAMAATTDMHSQCRLCRLVKETLEVETGMREAMSEETVLEAQTKDEAPGSVPP